MARLKKKKCAPFVAIEYVVLFDDRFLNLSSSAKVVYLAMAAKVKAPLGLARYAFEFAISYSEVSKWGLSPPTISKSLKELTQAGFIEVKECGGLRGCQGTTSTYTLSLRFKNT